MVTCCSLPPKYSVSVIDKEHETVSGVIENGHTKCLLDPTVHSESGVTQPSKSGMTEHSELGMIYPSERQPFLATVIGNERVTATGHWQDVRLLTFDIAGSHITYVTLWLVVLSVCDVSARCY